MIKLDEAKKKIKQIDPNIKPEIERVFLDVLDRKRLLNQQETFDDPLSRDYIHWIENRLAQPHLGYLDISQVNQTWGGSTTDALAKLAKNYFLAYDTRNPILGSDLLKALLDGTKSNEVPVAEKHSYDWFEARFKKLGYSFVDEPGRFNVLGVRGYLLPKGSVPNIGDLWNDTIFLIWKDKKGSKHVESFAASADPGRYYYSLKPMNPNGCAHLVNGQHKYVKGRHGASQYKAFVQGEPFTVARTNSANFTDRTKRESGYFGINLHAGYEYGNESVYNSSAGCQVIKSGGPTGYAWARFYNLLSQDTGSWFYYTLVDASNLI